MATLTTIPTTNDHVLAKGSSTSPEFVLINPDQMEALVQLLESRLPKSAHMYNCALRLSRHPGEEEMYALGGVLGPHAWILFRSTATCLGSGQAFGVSAPDLQSPSAAPSHVRQAFIETRAIDWDAPYEFGAIDEAAGALVTEISTFVKGNVLTSHPHLYYTMGREKAEALKVLPTEGTSVRPLNVEHGAEWITGQWKYANHSTKEYARAMIGRHPSCGVYVNSGAGAAPVSGALIHSDMTVGMLATEKGHQGKGYALLCMKGLLRSLAQEGYVPASAVELWNEASQRFHEKVGMRVSHKTVDLNTVGA